jgi:hypothetical protein
MRSRLAEGKLDAAKIASDVCIRVNKFGFASKFERLDEGGPGFTGDPREG